MSRFEDEKQEVIIKTVKLAMALIMTLICILAVVIVIAIVCLIGSGVWWLMSTLIVTGV